MGAKLIVVLISKSAIKNCELCGKPFKAYPCQLRKGQARFCSQKCFHHSPYGKDIHSKIAKYELPTLSKVERICQTCGNIFYRFPAQVKRGWDKFCSVKCRRQSSEGKVAQGKYERTPESKAKSSASKKGKYLGAGNPMFGRHHSGEIREKIRQKHFDYVARVPIDERRRGPMPEEHRAEISQSLKELWKDPEFVAKMMASFAKKPTKPERQLMGILNKHFPNFEYNGDFRLGIVLGALIPDFVNVNGKKEVIEVFGDYWHNRENMPWHRTELGRTMAYNSVGYKTLVIWEHDLKEKTEGEIVDMVKALTGRRTK